MLKIYLTGLSITMLYVSLSYLLTGTRLKGKNEVLTLLFIFLFWFITLPIIIIKVILMMKGDNK